MNLNRLSNGFIFLFLAWLFVFTSSDAIRTDAHAASAYGTMEVKTNLIRATFLMSGPVSYSGSGKNWRRMFAPAGTYTITYGYVSGFVTPASETKTLSSGGTISFTGEYKLNTGTIEVKTNLARATFLISGPASYSGSGKNWRRISTPAGTYTITYSDVPGFVTPASETKTLSSGGTISFTGDYKLSTGAIEVKTNLLRATFLISGPVSYRGSGKNWRRVGAPSGFYTITYADVSGFATPAGEAKTLDPGGTISFNGQYSESGISTTTTSIKQTSTSIHATTTTSIKGSSTTTITPQTTTTSESQTTTTVPLLTTTTSTQQSTTTTTENISFTISLNSGWNLISLPLQPLDTSIEAVTQPIKNQFTQIWTIIDGAQLTYYPDNPGLSTLVSMEAGFGYWINMKTETGLLLQGTAPSSSITLKKGSNLAGYNSIVAQTVEESLKSISGKYRRVWTFVNGELETYDPNDPDSNTLQVMRPGVGYWIDATEDCVWEME
ncbi:MAG: hypothetical protein NTZ51_04005 [Proteobacteria bacterium]|nr:hypothetical protein [Pseudomonadota bacterium]